MAVKLPSIVTRPLACPLSKCCCPLLPLAPENIPTVASAFLALFRSIVRWDLQRVSRGAITQLVLPGSPGTTPCEGGIVDRIFLDLLEEGLSPAEILASAKGLDGPRRIRKLALEDTSSVMPTNQLDRMFQCSATNFFLACQHSIPTAGPFCLHDFVCAASPTALDNIASNAAGLDEQAVPHAEYDPTDLIKRIAAKLEQRGLSEVPHWVGEGWKVEIAEAVGIYAKTAASIVFEELMGDAYMGKCWFAVELCPPIKLFTLLLEIDRPLISGTESFARSKEAQQLVKASQVPATDRKRLLDRIPASVRLFPASPTESSEGCSLRSPNSERH